MKQSAKSLAGPKMTNEKMRLIRRMREQTCVHGCYYLDTPNECGEPENGIPNCKREVELILEASTKEWQDKIVAKEELAARAELLGLFVKALRDRTTQGGVSP